VISRLALAAAAVIVATTGCGTKPPGPSATAPLSTGSAPAVWASPTRSSSTETRPIEPALVGTAWQLVEYSRNGHTTRVPATVDSALRFDRTGRYFARACNLMYGEMLITDRFVDLEPGVSTLIACVRGARAEVQTAVVEAIASGQLAWSIDYQRLELRQSNGDTLVYTVRDPSQPKLPIFQVVPRSG
jgi:heat shock protein HslJ